MIEKKYSIRVMTKQDLAQAVDWAAAEGWNPGLYDIESFYAADPNGFLVGYLGEEPISSISVVKYDDSYGFLGFYIVKPEYRGRGYGFELWQAGLQYLAGCNVGLDGVVEQQANYKQSGFKLAYGNIRFEGFGGGEEPEGIGLVDLCELPLSEVLDYDHAFFPADRQCFLQAWIGQTGSTALGIKQAGKLVGYGVIRPCRNGFKIGPLFAEDVLLAEELFLALKAHASATDNIYLDVPEVNLPGVALAEKYNMEPVFTTARMYTGDIPAISVNRTFGVTTFELG
ncbi:N-acetyltransferase [Photobacterium gaetbulicola]|uniref:GCN5-related N-acetyltransferase n=1 Tax=Photobacterium gaetbulicola Gung47 TaxID=658445 RepID=A0A0C5WIW1_9GAMM|nr:MULTISPECIES: GNAT family N-acetyltransferase [Photobacterium]AJR06112.1 GCN5-related N-acetyltransferase [Photobacterium gaetbulicola Gung47]PSU02701.1 N-acetyltransferase [Photobacterium gaetbulicola]WEM45464.1 GNAT family N-acetyltransferase [Photobacterium sp. DA100]